MFLSKNLNVLKKSWIFNKNLMLCVELNILKSNYAIKFESKFCYFWKFKVFDNCRDLLDFFSGPSVTYKNSHRILLLH